MVGTSKILTVSYGTFSCTLEGFDDSFNTMKAIAEYFRGLAADDRYFGAEPPTPDAEMLARIAEKEISRRVDARMENDGIVLRPAMITDAENTPAQPDEAPQTESTTSPETMTDDAAEKTADQDAEAEQAAKQKAEDEAKEARRAARRKARAEAEAKAEEDAKAKADADAKAKADADAKAKADADAKAKADADAKAKADADAKAKADADAKAKADADAKAKADADAKAKADADAKAKADADAKVKADAEAKAKADADAKAKADADAKAKADADAKVKADAEAKAKEDATSTSSPNDDSVAAKLQRIRAVVGAADADPTNDLTEDFLPEGGSLDIADEPSPEPIAAPVENDATNLEADQDEPAAKTATAPPPDMISRVMARQAAEAAPTPQSDADAETPEIETPAPAEPRARVVRMKRADFEKAKAAQAAKAQQVAAETEQPKEQPTEQPSGPDFGLLDGADDLDEYLEDSDFNDIDVAAELSDDLAADLENIAASAPEVAEEIVAQTPEPTPAPSEPAPKTAQDAAQNFAAKSDDVDDAALDRLMSETDAQMQEPEGSRRRNAIAQLKAAVAAKQAARKVGEDDDDGQDVENAFRNDLSDVVRPDATPRPRQVVRKDTRTERPRPAPLKLVAAQRVDLPETKPTHRDAPVIPRRVATRTPAATDKGAGSFAEFAENMDARELPDLLEAAAAYTAFVEGAGEFSRPQILRRVRSVAADEFNREDGLRSFADLLRSGRFTKIRNGRFQVADDSRFNPERQAS